MSRIRSFIYNWLCSLRGRDATRLQQRIYDEIAQGGNSAVQVRGDRSWTAASPPPYLARQVRDDVERLRPHLPENPRLLDLGCGPGLYLQHLHTWARATGMDLSGSVLQRYTRPALPAVPLVQASMFALPFAERSFDAVLALNVLMHCRRRDLSGCLTALAGLLRPGGVVCIDFPRFRWTDLFWSDFSYARHRPKRVGRILAELGFETLEQYSAERNNYPAEFILARRRGVAP